jgi:mono/diheme cytochrome c family protein
MSDVFARGQRPLLLAAFVMGVLASAHAAGSTLAPSRGELLYATHCVECHNQQIHWRDRTLARNWATLREQVDRWQRAARLDWSDEDIDAVSRHLNEAVYGFPLPQRQALGRVAPPAR